jgi:hypothetical protein
MYLRRHELGLRRFAAVIRNRLKSLVRRLFATLLRRFAVLVRFAQFYWCGGCAADAVVKPSIPPYAFAHPFGWCACVAVKPSGAVARRVLVGPFSGTVKI